MQIIETKANQIAAEMEKMGEERRLAFDVMLILTLVSIVIEVVKLYRDCHQTPQQAAVSMRSNGILERWRLRKVIRNHVDDPEMYSYVGSKMFDSTMKVATSVTDEDVQSMYAEVQS